MEHQPQSFEPQKSSLPPTSTFPFASIIEILRSDSKDKDYIKYLNSNLSNSLSLLLSPATYVKFVNYIYPLSLILYYGFTFGLGRPTLGEEYCEIFTTSSDGYTSPNRRWLYICFLLLRKKWRIFGLISAVHSFLFYLNGSYIDIGKQILRLRQASAHPSPTEVHLSLRPLQAMAIAKIALKLSHLLPKPPSPNACEEENEEYESSLGECSLCIQPRKCSTIAGCGHIFCWECICAWLKTKSECPLCRHPCAHQQLFTVYY